MSPTPTSDRAPRNGERGFTLAALLVILTIIAVTVAYTVPKSWSLIIKRDQDRQTLFIMKQYARAIDTFQKKHGALPTSLDQLKEARNPRVLRGHDGEWVDPLTGKVDWIRLPPTVNATPRPLDNYNPSANKPNAAGPARPTFGTTQDANGPFVGVRPGKTGDSYLKVNGAEKYEEWTYTIVELQQEINAQVLGTAPNQVPNQVPNQNPTQNPPPRP
jgi:type II secretory pathway pseudopilin PulG